MPLDDESPMPFGKFIGRPMREIPVSYLHYLWTHGVSSDVTTDVHKYISANKLALEQENEDLIWDED